MTRGLHLASVSGLLAIVVLRAIVSVDPFPGWSDDPTRLPMVFAGLGAGQEAALDLAALVVACVAISGWRGMGPRWWELALGSAGMAGAMAHARWLGPGDPESLAVSVNWCAAIATALAMRGAAGDRLLARLAGAALLGLVGMLACKALAQFLVDQPQAYEDFKRNKAMILAARGWTEGSSMALSFERRISQREAVGWFGLSNVFGSVCADAGVALAALAALARDIRKGRGFVMFGAALAAGALAMSMSKGAAAGGGLGLGLLAVAMVVAKRWAGAWRRWGGFVGLACVAGPLALVALRGAIGERLGELSLWFRWFYWQGASRVVGDHPWLGVGPGNFQDAYVARRPALSPEAAASPHSVLIDFAACLGALGLAWGVLVIAWAWNAGIACGNRTANNADHEDRARLTPRGELRLAVAIGALPLVVAALLERETASPLGTLVRAGGLLLFALIGAGVLARARERPAALGPALAIGALAVLAHAQIEMTATTPGSSLWFMAMLGLAGGGASDPSTSKARRWSALAAGAAVAVGAVVVLGPPVLRACRWEGALRRAAAAVRPLAMARALGGAGSGPEAAREASAVLGEALGRPVGATPRELDAAMGEVEAREAPVSLELLRSAAGLAPRHFGTHRALSEVLVRAAMLARAEAPDLAGRLVVEAEQEMAAYAQRVPVKSSAWSWLGTLRTQIAESGFDGSARERAVEAWTRSSEIDRTGVASIPPLVEALAEIGRTSEARAWAAQGLLRHANQRLDPLAGLTDAQKRRLEAVAGR